MWWHQNNVIKKEQLAYNICESKNIYYLQGKERILLKKNPASDQNFVKVALITTFMNIALITTFILSFNLFLLWGLVIYTFCLQYPHRNWNNKVRQPKKPTMCGVSWNYFFQNIFTQGCHYWYCYVTTDYILLKPYISERYLPSVHY